MNNQDNTNGKVIKGIHCEVKNCEYHKEGDHCTAGQIEVGPGFAVSNGDTNCATFKYQ